MQTALLIIDVQQALCAGDYEAVDAAGVIERINLVSSHVRGAGGLVVFIQHESAEGPLAYGSEGWKLAVGLDSRRGDVYLRKQATDSFHNTDLNAVLESRGVKQLIICGMQSEFCVDTTIRRALALGYPVTLVADGHSTMNNEVLTAEQISKHHNVTLANITSFGPRVTPLRASEIQVEA